MLKCWLVFCLSLLIIACDGSQIDIVRFNGLDVSSAAYARDFNLKDLEGVSRSLPDYQGKIVVIFFGYTHCPDVCPTTLSDMAKAMKLLGSQRQNVQVLFVTLDPERDTPEMLRKFLPSFDAGFVGLYGTLDQVNEVSKEFKVFRKRQNNVGLGAYTIDHTAGTYVYDRLGQLRLYFKYGQKPDEIANDLKKLM
jgi:protein SCO1/2